MLQTAARGVGRILRLLRTSRLCLHRGRSPPGRAPLRGGGRRQLHPDCLQGSGPAFPGRRPGTRLPPAGAGRPRQGQAPPLWPSSAGAPAPSPACALPSGRASRAAPTQRWQLLKASLAWAQSPAGRAGVTCPLLAHSPSLRSRGWREPGLGWAGLGWGESDPSPQKRSCNLSQGLKHGAL